jgi:hypothetical protein
MNSKAERQVSTLRLKMFKGVVDEFATVEGDERFFDSTEAAAVSPSKNNGSGFFHTLRMSVRTLWVNVVLAR